MKKLFNASKSDGILALLLFAVFAVCVLSVLLTGADAFRGLAERDQSGFDRRTATQYIATRVRQADRADGVALEDFCGLTALVCREEYDGEMYCTRIYCYDGYICELFCSAEAVLLPEDGEKIIAVAALSFSEHDGLITASVTDLSGETADISLTLRSRKEVTP